MASEDFPNIIFTQEFIDDLYAEYEERLGDTQHDILLLETFIDSPLDGALLDGLLRHLHTLKGLAATINLKEGEQLFHQLESYLRMVKRSQENLSLSGFEVLVAGVNMSEQLIIAHHAQTPLPDITSIISALASVHPTSSSTEVPSSHPQIQGEDMQLWDFEFTPSPALVERGINVNVIRQRLESLGHLLEAKPTINAQGAVAFEFLLATSAHETTFAQWCEEGLSYRPTATQPDQPSASPLLSMATFPNVVRVDLARLEELMRMIGELVTSLARQANLVKQFRPLLPVAPWRALQETHLTLQRQLRNLREGVMRVRMVPIGTVFERMKFVIRELVSGTSKQIKLELIGQETEIDKLVVDQMMEPLLHLVRNAGSHGLESSEERIAQGKSPEGKITLRAHTAGDAVVIEIEDDGRGIDLEKVMFKARSQGLLNQETPLNPNTLLELLCKPGFSTQEQLNLTSGRGVGMDVVKNVVNALGGSIALHTQIQKGTRFTIQLPLTLAILDALIVAVGQQKFAIPQLSVHEVLEIDPTAITLLENHEMISHREGVLVLIRLAHFFHLQTDRRKVYILVVSQEVGIVVDQILGEREIVVRPLHDPLIQVRGISGATELGDGKVVLILDVTTLVNIAKSKNIH